MGQNMTGIDNMLYMESTSSSAGRATTTLTFAPGTDPDIAQVQVQNKLQLAEALLPQAVTQQGVSVTKASTSFLMVVGLISKTGQMDRSDIADYANSYIRDPLSRTKGKQYKEKNNTKIRSTHTISSRLKSKEALVKKKTGKNP